MNSEGLVKLKLVRVRYPACGKQVDGRVKGYCAISRQRVDFLIEMGKNPTAETAKISASVKKRQDGVVLDYLRGDKTIVIQLKYGISPGKMYRIVHAQGVELRTGKRTRYDGGTR